MSRCSDTIHQLISPFVWIPVVSTELQRLVTLLLSTSPVNAVLSSRAYQLSEHAIQQQAIVSHSFALPHVMLIQLSGKSREWTR